MLVSGSMQSTRIIHEDLRKEAIWNHMYVSLHPIVIPLRPFEIFCCCFRRYIHKHPLNFRFLTSDKNIICSIPDIRLIPINLRPASQVAIILNASIINSSLHNIVFLNKTNPCSQMTTSSPEPSSVPKSSLKSFHSNRITKPTVSIYGPATMTEVNL